MTRGAPAAPPLRVLIADDHPLFRLGLSLALASAGFEVVGEVENGALAVERCRQEKTDIAVLDVRMPELDGIDACQQIRALPDPPVVVMLTTFDEPGVIEAARSAGATAYLSKETEPKELARTLQRIVAEPDRDWLPTVALPPLTPRELDVLGWLALGLSNKAIAARLNLSPATVKDHVDNIYRKLEVRDRVSALRRATELGLA